LRWGGSQVGACNLAFIVPAYNESKSIGSVVTNLKEYGIVIVIDDGQCDEQFISCGFRAGSSSEGGIAAHDEISLWKQITIPVILVTHQTGERLKKVQKYVSEPFFLTYGDGLSDVDILKTYKFYKKNKKIGLVTAINPLERYGILKLKKNNIVYNFSEKPKNSTHWINGGFFIFNNKFFKYLKFNNPILERKPLQNLSKKNQLIAFKHKGFWKAMDTLRDKIELNKIWYSGKAKWKKRKN
jgi:glucose-1-phosphate cytidylyltransferase